MAKIEFAFPVDKVHGRISKQHQVGFAHRKASKLNYSTSYGTRITPYSQDEMAHQEKFKAVCASTRARMKDPGKVMQDQAAFKEQTKYKTFYRYVFNLEWEAYEALLRSSLENGLRHPKNQQIFRGPRTPYSLEAMDILPLLTKQ